MEFIVEPQYKKGRPIQKKIRFKSDVVVLNSQCETKTMTAFAENDRRELISPSITDMSSDGMMICGFEAINGTIYGQAWWLRNVKQNQTEEKQNETDNRKAD